MKYPSSGGIWREKDGELVPDDGAAPAEEIAPAAALPSPAAPALPEDWPAGLPVEPEPEPEPAPEAEPDTPPEPGPRPGRRKRRQAAATENEDI